ncbi:MAG TPA: thioredoxin family protein [Polyangiaceae bacterium]|nr:thioredoxin family protein [Polyangiaceae bacterium]
MNLRPAVLVALFVATGCKSGDTPGRAPSPAASAALAPVKRPIFVRGPTGGAPVAPFIAGELTTARAGHYGLLVYVGATWCEPCQGFHRAVAAGELDDLLAGVHLIEFDLDADREPLAAAGYSSQLIPLFALPKPDGTASEARIEGSIKGADAVERNLMPRLRAFLKGQQTG